MEGCSAGPARAAWLVRHVLPHEAWLRRYLGRLAHGPDEIDDVVQDCFVKLLALDGVDGIDDVRALMARMGRNLLIDRHRRRACVPFVDLCEAGEMASDDCPADRACDARQALARVSRAFDAMSVSRRRVVWRRRIDGASGRIVATELGVTLSAVEKHLYGAIRVLREAGEGAAASPGA
ncbi:RNA polymerase sigma factor [Sphingomonas colocasiae]|uniref:RNA polymerase sigma factor n=1 Tax=Sphingomonas colocasiae TaxID=1848973 RepID=A0ABS7PPH1_9SPHN|nr:RNA polymerase sigma factor [Sphingomonas colocasiae]